MYQPQVPEDLAGVVQRQVANSLIEKLRTGIVTQTLLLCGPSGVGKTTISKMYTRELIGDANLITHVNCGQESGVAFVREQLLPLMITTPLLTEYTVILLDEIHALSNSAQDALLIRLENLPNHVVILAATTEPNKLRPALSSRLGRLDLPIPDRKELGKLMLKIFDSSNILVQGLNKVENPKLITTKDIAGSMIDKAGGNVRQLVNYIQQLVDGYYNPDSEEKEGESLVKLMLANKSKPELFKSANSITNYQQEVIQICSYVIRILQSTDDPRASLILSIFGRGLNNSLSDKVSFFYLLNEFFEST